MQYLNSHKYSNCFLHFICKFFGFHLQSYTQNLFSRLVKDLAEKENVKEKFKADNQMLWVQKMNNIRNQATEIINAELIYTV